MTIWIDAQLSPALADWIDRRYEDLQATPVRAVGLRDAEDEESFRAAREATAAGGMVVMRKDSDFLNLLERHGPPPKVIWLTCGNTSNRRMREILKRRLRPAAELLKSGETLVEISDL